MSKSVRVIVTSKGGAIVDVDVWVLIYQLLMQGKLLPDFDMDDMCIAVAVESAGMMYMAGKPESMSDES